MKKFLFYALCAMLYAAPASAVCVYYTGNEYVCLSSDPALTAPADGARRYNSDTRKHYLKVSSAWQEITDHDNLANKGTNTHSGIDDHIGSTVKHVTEGDKVLLNSASTGVLEGCLVTKNADPVYFDVTECIVRFVDNTTDPLSPTTSTVYVSAQAHVTVTNLATWEGTYLGINTSGNIVQQQTAWTPVQYRTIVPIAFLFHANNIDIKSALTHVHAAFDPSARLEDLSHSIGIMNLSGNQYGANGVNLNVNKSAGSSHASGANFQVDPKTPDITTDPSMTPMPSVPRSYRDGAGGWTQTSFSVLNPNNYDDGTGTLPAVPAGNWVAIPLYYIPGLSTDSTGGARQQYPQRYFATKAEALADLPDPLFIKNPNLINGTIRTYCVVQQGTTNLSDTAKAEFVQMGKFSEVSGGAGAGGGGAPTDGEYVTYTANTLLTNERVLTDGVNTTVDTGTAGQVKLNLSGTLDGDLLPALSTTKRGGVAATGTPSNKFYRDDDTWQTISAGGAPTTSKYLLQQADGSLPNAQAMGALSTGIVKNTTTTGVQSIASSGTDYGPPTSGNATGLIISTTGTGAHTAYGGASCTNQFPRSLNASGAATCASVADADLASSYSGVGACGANLWASTLNDNAAPTCTQPAFSNLSGRAALNQITDNDTTANLCMVSGGAGGEPNYTTCPGGGAPTTAGYWTKTGDAGLSNEQDMSALGSGLILNTTTTGVPTIYAGTSCTNQYPRSLNASGAATCAGVGVADFTANQGTTTQVLHGNAAGQPAWGGIVTADLPTIDISKGGTTETASTEDAVLVGASTTDWVPKVLPSCSNATTSKLLYDNSTNTFSCGTDQTAGGGPTTAKLTADYTNSTTTGTNVSGLNVTLAAGTWRYSYWLAVRIATIANASDFGVNFSGTQTLLTAQLTYQDTGVSTSNGIIDNVVTGDGAETIIAGCVNTAVSTTAPNLNCFTSATTAATDMFVRVEGMIVVTVSGTLQLYAASESTTEIRVMTGSTLLATPF